MIKKNVKRNKSTSVKVNNKQQNKLKKSNHSKSQLKKKKSTIKVCLINNVLNFIFN